MAAEGEWVFFCDTDGTHDPADFWTLWERREGAGVVAGVKEGRKDPFYRKFASRLYNLFIRFKFGVKVRDTNAGFKLLSREVVETVVPKVNRLKLGFSTELLIRARWAGHKLVPVPVQHF